MVFLTDGGGEHRIEETRKSLRALGLLDKATFLPHTEQSFYNALLDLDILFFAKVAGEIRAILKDWKPEQIICDAVEFYNPVHDMTLPIVCAADDENYEGVFEMPLIYQKTGEKEAYGVQTVPDNVIDRVTISLTQEESDLKVNALQDIYTILRDTLGRVLLASPDALKQETLVPAQSPIRWPDPGRLLRYEQRAAHLMKKGEIRSEITHAYHFLPIVSELLGE